MAKLKQNSDTNQNQGSIFDLIKQQHEERLLQDPKTGTLNITLQLQEIIDKCIGQSPLSRDIIAGRMSELTGHQITRVMLDSWTSSAKQKHRFPAEFLPAFCVAVENNTPLNFLAGKCGIFTMLDKDVLLAEMARKMSTRDEANKEIKKIKVFLQELP
ncbi:MAG: hypothetical protein ABFD76_09005 [Smithella sp.]